MFGEVENFGASRLFGKLGIRFQEPPKPFLSTWFCTVDLLSISQVGTVKLELIGTEPWIENLGERGEDSVPASCAKPAPSGEELPELGGRTIQFVDVVALNELAGSWGYIERTVWEQAGRSSGNRVQTPEAIDLLV